MVMLCETGVASISVHMESPVFKRREEVKGYDVAGRVIELIEALDRHDDSYVIINDDSSTWMDYVETIESIMDVRLDDYDAVIIEITDDDLDDLKDVLDSDVQVIAFARTDVDGLSDYDFDLIDEA